MRDGALAVPFGAGGTAVESDETFIGRKKALPFGADTLTSAPSLACLIAKRAKFAPSTLTERALRTLCRS